MSLPHTPWRSTMKTTRNLVLVALVSLASLVGFASPAFADSPAGQCSPAHRAEMTAFAENYIDFYNNLGAAPYTSIYTEDATLASTAGVFQGVGEIEAAMGLFLGAIPDLQYQMEDIWVDGDQFILRYSYSGTHLGDFMGIPATGNPIKVYGLEVNTVKGGKVVHTHNFTDFFGLLAQLGAISL